MAAHGAIARPMRRRVTAGAIALVLATFIAWAASSNASAAGLPTAPLTIVTADHAEHHFIVELATTEAERERGLMYRTSLAPDAGMLFDFKRPQVVAFWMKNTEIPLDMLFIDAQGRIVTIAERAVPESLAPIGSGQPVLAVLEVNGGTVARLGIKVGDRVIEAMFKR